MNSNNLLKGSFVIESQLGKGTMVLVDFPIEARG